MSPFGMLAGTDAQGTDIPCIGRPAGMTRGMYSETAKGEDYSTTIVYYKKGNDFQNVKEYFSSKAESCGWSKASETSASITTPGFSMKQGSVLKYGREDNSLTVTVVAVSTTDGKEYTMANAVLEHYTEEEQEGSEQQTTGSETTGFDSIMEQQAPAEAQDYAQLIKPALSSAFGDAKLTSYTVIGNNTNLLYATKNLLNSKNTGELKQELSKVLVPEGYSNTISSTTSERFTFSYKNREGDTITVSGDMGNSQVIVWIVPKT